MRDLAILCCLLAGCGLKIGQKKPVNLKETRVIMCYMETQHRGTCCWLEDMPVEEEGKTESIEVRWYGL